MKWLKARLKEGGSWASLAAAVGMWAPAFPSYSTVIYVLAGVCATVGFALKEASNATDA